MEIFLTRKIDKAFIILMIKIIDNYNTNNFIFMTIVKVARIIVIKIKTICAVINKSSARFTNELKII